MNAFHEQQNSVKRNDNDEEETIDTKSKLEKQEQNHTTLEDVFEAAFKELTKNSAKSKPEGQENDDMENHLKILTPNKNTKSRMNKSFKLLQNLHVYQQKFK